MDGYQKQTRPVKDHRTPTNLSISITIWRVSDFDIDSLTMTSENYMTINWQDEHLTWNPSDYNGLENLQFSRFEVWVPLLRSFDFTHRWDADNWLPWTVNVSYTGNVYWWPTFIWKSYCFTDLKNYPFDKHLCILRFASWTYDSRHLKIVELIEKDYWGRNPVVGPLVENPFWHVDQISDAFIRNNVTEEGRHDSVRIEFHLQRRLGSYTYTVFLPYLSSWIFAFASFTEPIGCKRRLTLTSISITIYLVLLIRMSIELGSHSLSIPYGIKCCSLSIMIISIATFLPLLLQRLSTSQFLLPRFIVNFLAMDWINRISCISDSDSDNSHLLHQQENHNETPEERVSQMNREVKETDVKAREWITFSLFVDRIGLLTFVVLSLIYHS